MQIFIHKSGAWYAYNGEKIGQGRENSKKYLEDHPDIAETVEHAIRVHYGLLEEDAENANNDPKAEAIRFLKNNDHYELR